MTTRANWFLDELVPLEAEIPSPTVQEVGHRVDLRDPQTLVEAYVEQVRDEQALHNAGVTCAVKAKDDTCCSACIVRRTDPDDPLSALCKLGVLQERTLTEMAVAQCAADGPSAPDS